MRQTLGKSLRKGRKSARVESAPAHNARGRRELGAGFEAAAGSSGVSPSTFSERIGVAWSATERPTAGVAMGAWRRFISCAKKKDSNREAIDGFKARAVASSNSSVSWSEARAKRPPNVPKKPF